MKTVIFTIALCLITSISFAADWSWDRADVLREVAGEVLTVIDLGQTQDIRNHNGMIELNPILGRTPSREAVRNYFTAVLIIHPLVSALLPKEADILGFKLQPRTAWQYFYLGVETTATVSNYRGGLRLDF